MPVSFDGMVIQLSLKTGVRIPVGLFSWWYFLSGVVPPMISATLDSKGAATDILWRSDEEEDQPPWERRVPDRNPSRSEGGGGESCFGYFYLTNY